MNKELMFSSQTGEWSTPQNFYDKLDEEFHFTLDPCATDDNAKCDMYITQEEDGLAQDWSNYSKSVFVNPPYGRGIGKWVKKSYDESKKGATVVCLLPARTDTAWFHNYIYGIAEIRFIKGRLKFGGSPNAAPFPSMVVIFRGAQIPEQ